MHSTACTLLTCMPKWDVKMNQTIKADDVPGMIERCMRHGEWNLVGWAIQPGNHCLAWTIKKPKPKKIKRAILKWVGMSPRLEQKEATCLGLTVGTRQLLVLWRGGLGFALFFSFFFILYTCKIVGFCLSGKLAGFRKNRGTPSPGCFQFKLVQKPMAGSSLSGVHQGPEYPKSPPPPTHSSPYQSLPPH